MSPRTLDAIVDEGGPWGTTQWWRLELRAFDRAPSVQVALAVLAPKDAWTREHGRPSVGGCLQAFAYLVSLVAPTLGAGLVVGWAQQGARDVRALEVAGVLLLVSVLVTLYSEVRGRLQPRAVAIGAVRRVALAHLLPDALALVVAAVVVASGTIDVATSLLWLTPFVVDAGLHVMTWLRGSTQPGGPQHPLDNVDRSVAELRPDRREAIARDLHAAIERLRATGRIDDELAARASACAPGRLALTIAPEGRSAYFPAGSEDLGDGARGDR